jgi:hypothetical protein
MLRNDLRDVWAAPIWSRPILSLEDFSHANSADSANTWGMIAAIEGFISRKFSRFSKYMGGIAAIEGFSLTQIQQI